MKTNCLKALVLLLIPILVHGKISRAQDAPVYEQYVFDNTLLNPAFTGLVDIISVKAAHRQQWINFGAHNTPNTSFLLFRSRLKERDGGLGGYIYSDRNGVNSQIGMEFNGSFQFLMKTNRKTRTILSLGFGVSAFMHTYDETEFFDRDIYDPIVDYGTKNYFGYDANFGVLLSHKDLVAGVSFNNLLQWTNPVYNLDLERPKSINMNVHVGNIFWLADQIQLCPLLVYKSNFNKLNQIDLGVRVKFLFGKSVPSKYVRSESEFVVGVIYKHTFDVGNISPLSVSPMVGVVVKGITITYLCDLGLTSIQKYNYGTHQVALGFRLYRDKFTSTGKHNVASMVYDF